ncbi:Protein of unknown function (DUF3054) [Haloactinopolyspora alba]|uniref:DUF3054 family protein n=1 Tax=Haloactinopolyspora alba TaxID=648780 RepID=A0A2P8DVT5_9ACTN|nr:DUF3054 domain-containing protein [Haloactinopolyspora alba]PSL01348.1 Protein of unknown function (DUF3054) [Haloactinopolyspora alba]
MSRAAVAALVDVLLVVAFVLLGRRTHEGVGDLAGIATTAWPFLTGLASGWLAARAWRRPRSVLPTGVTVWAATVLVGMLLRAVSGQGTAPSFVVVATVVLGVFLIGWRLLSMPRTGRTDAERR